MNDLTLASELFDSLGVSAIVLSRQEVRSFAPRSRAGVYLIFAATGELSYVGKAATWTVRLKQQVRKREFDVAIVIELDSYVRVQRLERILIHLLRPSDNRKLNSGKLRRYPGW